MPLATKFSSLVTSDEWLPVIKSDDPLNMTSSDIMSPLTQYQRQWRPCVVVITTAKLHSIEPKLIGSAQVHILLAVCRRFVMVRTSDNRPNWK